MKDTTLSGRSRLSILVCDIVRSMAFYEHLGDAAALDLVTSCLKTLAERVEASGGCVIKSMGDGLLCSFKSEAAALRAAASMSAKAMSDSLEIRIGVHCGAVMEDGGDVYGDVVNTTARIAALAKPSEILLSSRLRSFLPAFLAPLAKEVPPIEVKGKAQPLELVAIQFSKLSQALNSEASDLHTTVMIPGAQEKGSDVLELTYGKHTVRLQPGASLTIGRLPENGLVVANPAVSRLHAEISYRQGKFELQDCSVNGTFLVQSRATLHLVREKTFLLGSGSIHVGAPPEQEGAEVIRFALVPRTRASYTAPILRRALEAARLTRH